MHLYVTKPSKGKVTITVDDRRGATGRRSAVKDVPVADVRTETAALVASWETHRKAIYEARKPTSA